MKYINTTLDNRLWVHRGGKPEYLSTVAVRSIDWFAECESVVVLEGFLQKDRWLLDIQDKDLSFEVLFGTCGDPMQYESGKTLMRFENLRDFSWWTEDVMGMHEASRTGLFCCFTCDWVEICE